MATVGKGFVAYIIYVIETFLLVLISANVMNEVSKDCCLIFLQNKNVIIIEVFVLHLNLFFKLSQVFTQYFESDTPENCQAKQNISKLTKKEIGNNCLL